MRVAVLASGEGSNLQAILDNVHERHNVEVVLVVSDKPDARALDRAAAAGIATATFPLADFPDREARDRAIGERIRAANVGLIVLAGYMAILSSAFVQRFDGMLINVHPSLLPKYPGLRAIEQALEAGDDQTGVTVHYVDEGVDTGEPIAQELLGIGPGESLEQLTERIHAVEHRLLPEVIAQLAFARSNG